jgi:hypothetical protein
MGEDRSIVVLAPARSSEKGREPQGTEPTKAEAEEQSHNRTHADSNPSSTLAIVQRSECPQKCEGGHEEDQANNES